MSANIIALGLTGSVGKSFLQILEKYPEQFLLAGFSYHNNFSKAKEIQKKFLSRYVCSTNPQVKKEEREYWQKNGVTFSTNMEELLDISYDTILTAVVGAVGVRATYKAAQQGKKILLANKEALVMGGSIIMQEAQTHRAQILPVDSEHSSIFRLLGSHKNSASHIILTASGGPFRGATLAQIQSASKAQVLAHPTWNMGHKISVDSAGMVNKALEIIEAHHLFQLPYSHISAVIHPQSYVHAILQNSDGSFSLHVSEPNMVYPLAYALFYPQPSPALCSPNLTGEQKILSMPSLEFMPIEKEKFPAFFLGLQAGKKGSTFSAVFNATNEEAVKLFLQEHISFTQIPPLIETALDKFTSQTDSAEEISLHNLFAADVWARDFCKKNYATILKIT